MARRPLTPFGFGGVPAAQGRLGADPFLALHREMNRLFDEALGGFGAPAPSAAGGGAPTLMPQMEASETERELKITVELPGVAEDDVDVTLDDDGVLTLRGEKKLERREEKQNLHFTERSFGSFQRSLRLPFPVDPDQIQARFDNGVLTVTLPKAQAQERTRRIQIQGGGTSARNEQAEASSAATDAAAAHPS